VQGDREIYFKNMGYSMNLVSKRDLNHSNTVDLRIQFKVTILKRI